MLALASREQPSQPAPQINIENRIPEMPMVAVRDASGNTGIVSRSPDIHMHLPQEMRVMQDAPTFNIPPANVTVNVPPAEVTVNVEPTPVTVDVPTQTPPIVYVQPAESGSESITFKRDAAGRIIGATKES
jgi:hypothetical protein